MKYIVAILIFTLIIMFHEWGHYLLARANGVVVEEFFLGFGPDLISKKIGDTKYSIKLLWLGGACVMKGEDTETEEADSEGSFQSVNVWGRMSIVLAGPIFNFILAFLLSIVLIGMIGFDEPIIAGFFEGSAAAESGMEAGDRIVEINGTPIHIRREASLYMYMHPAAANEEVTIVYERDGEKYTTSFLPTYVENEDGSGSYYLGLNMISTRTKGNVIQILGYSIHEVGYWIKTTIMSLKMLITGSVSANELSGPVGIVKTIGDTYSSAQSSGGALLVFVNMLNISILLTANLGVMNLLPIPALDGGRFLFMVVEAIRGKKVDPEKEGFVHMIGFAILFALMILIMFNDIRNIFTGIY